MPLGHKQRGQHKARRYGPQGQLKMSDATERRQKSKKGARHVRPLGWLAQTSWFEVCDAPQGHFKKRRSALASIPDRSLREIADPKGRGSAPARLHRRTPAPILPRLAGKSKRVSAKPAPPRPALIRCVEPTLMASITREMASG